MADGSSTAPAVVLLPRFSGAAFLYMASREHHIELLLDGALEAAARLQRAADKWGKVISQINLQLD